MSVEQTGGTLVFTTSKICDFVELKMKPSPLTGALTFKLTK